MLREGAPLVHFYDPVKAHEYYVKNRKLKGRKKGAVKPPPGVRPAALRSVAKQKPKMSPQEKARKLAAVNQRITAIKKHIADLEHKLKDAQAKERKTAAKKKAGPTAADKHKQAKDDKKYRDKHKQELKNKSSKAGGSNTKSAHGGDGGSVDSLKSQITTARGALSTVTQIKKQISQA